MTSPRLTPQDVMTLINIFNVNPSRCDELVTALTEATTDTLAQFPGFVSANIHRSHDNATVINYAQWATWAGKSFCFEAVQCGWTGEAARHQHVADALTAHLRTMENHRPIPTAP